VVFDLGGFQAGAESVFQAEDGRYVVCGPADTIESVGGVGAIAIARLLENGALDTSFDFDGRRTLQVPHPAGGDLQVGGYCAPAAGGGIVVAGGVYDSADVAAATQVSVVVARLLPDGSLDTAFNGSGYTVFDPAGGTNIAIATDVIVQPDGTVVVAGAADVGTAPTRNYDMFAARLLSNGSLDSTFGSAGVRLVGFDQGGANGDIAAALAPVPGGGLILVGSANTASNGTDVALARLHGNGDLVPEFGTGGRALIGFDGGDDLGDLASAVALDDAGNFILAGEVAVAAANRDLAVLRVTDAGALDAGFASGGWHVFGIDTAPGQNTEFAQAVVLDGSGRAVVAGAAHMGTAASFDGLVLRLTSDLVFSDGFEALP